MLLYGRVNFSTEGLHAPNAVSIFVVAIHSDSHRREAFMLL